ncbi:unnamed protein product, partial [Toxocara canis]|uniref:Protein kinase domain-containing protein n=1 Tax=Toxocara canis TaxID=6265 RepID=A0A183UBJ5_TOXCA
VKIVRVKRGTAIVEKGNGERGEVPTYFLELDTVPGKTFAEQIEYRREWYRRIDEETISGPALQRDNASTLLSNVGSLIDLASFIPIEASRSQLQIDCDRRPLCVESLNDMIVKTRSTLMLSCVFHSNDPYTVTWRGPAISRKADFQVKSCDDGESTFMLHECTPADSGQYWVEAENKYGKSDTVAWVTVIDAPEVPPSITCRAVRGSGLKLHWRQPRKGNARYVWYIVEYKCEGMLCRKSRMSDYEVAADGLMSCSVLISDLKPMQYSFRVRAFNELFRGEASRTLNVKPSIELIRSAARTAFLDEYNTKVKYLDEKFFEYYAVGEVVGRGRFSLVKGAVCSASQRRFAAKFLTRHPMYGIDLDEACIEKEIRTLYTLRHSNIVSLRTAVKTAHDFIIVMKWINGPPILKYITRLGYVSEQLIRRLFRDALAALDYMHAFNIAHLDLKPEDLLVHLSKHGARLVLVDLGSSHICIPSMRPLSYMPTEFASPEQHLHKSPTTKSDIWSVGIILYVLACGQLPFNDNNEELMKLNIISGSVLIDGVASLERFSASLKSFLKSVLVWNATDRPTAADCLRTEWMRNELAEEYLLVDYLEDYVEKRELQLRACCLHEDVDR